MKSLHQNKLIQKRRESVQVSKQKFREHQLDPQKFCIMPFVNIILEPTGSIGICRQKGTDFSMGNIKDGGLKKVWNNDKIRAWRRDFLDGKAEVCDRELRHRQCQLCPQLNQLLPHASLKEVIESPPLRLTANLNGKCNLECQMCHIWQMPNDVYNEENFWGPAREMMFPYLKEVDMLSGEPFIQADTFRLIDEISNVNPDCEWSFTTNAHWLLNKKIIGALEKVKVKNLMISIDSLDHATYAKIRKKGNLDLVLRNLELLQAYEQDRISRGLSNFSMNLNITIQKDNWREAKDMIDWGLERNLHPLFIFCYEPLQHSLLSLSRDQRREILDCYLNYDWTYLSMLKKIWHPVVDSLEKHEKAYYFQAFLGKREQLQATYL
jgi:cyclic pyranopterin phosphate synthase